MIKENLLLLSEFLMRNEVPFEMGAWRCTLEEDADGGMEIVDQTLTLDELDAGLNRCGTGGCALGWAPFVIPPSKKCIVDLETTKHGRIHFPTYEEDAFDLEYDESKSVFDSEWVQADNSREGAAFRLAALATYGKVFDPDDIRWSLTERNAYLQARYEWVTKWEQANEKNQS